MHWNDQNVHVTQQYGFFTIEFNIFEVSDQTTNNRERRNLSSHKKKMKTIRKDLDTIHLCSYSLFHWFRFLLFCLFSSGIANQYGAQKTIIQFSYRFHSSYRSHKSSKASYNIDSLSFPLAVEVPYEGTKHFWEGPSVIRDVPPWK